MCHIIAFSTHMPGSREARCTVSIRVVFLLRRSPSSTTLVLSLYSTQEYSRCRWTGVQSLLFLHFEVLHQWFLSRCLSANLSVLPYCLPAYLSSYLPDCMSGCLPNRLHACLSAFTILAEKGEWALDKQYRETKVISINNIFIGFFYGMSFDAVRPPFPSEQSR